MKQTYTVCFLVENLKNQDILSEARKGGHAIRVWYPGTLEPAIQSKIASSWKDRPGEIIPDLFTAIKDSDIIINTLSRSTFTGILDDFLRFLEKYQVVIMYPAFSWSAMVLYGSIQEKRPGLQVYVGESVNVTAWYSDIKFKGDREKGSSTTTYCCFYPEKANAYVDFIITGVYPRWEMVDTIEKASMMNITTIITPVLFLFNMNLFKKKVNVDSHPFNFLPEIANLIEHLDVERCAIMKKIGLVPRAIPEMITPDPNRSFNDYHVIFNDISSILPYSYMNVRNIIRESIDMGVEQMAFMGKKLGVGTPTMDAMITITRAFSGTGTSEKALLFKMEDVQDWIDERQKTIIKAPENRSDKKPSTGGIIDKMCDQILSHLQEDWLFIQAPRELLFMVKEIIHEDARYLSQENWKEFYSSSKKNVHIAITRKTEELKERLGSDPEFDNFGGVILDYQGAQIHVTPLFFHGANDMKSFITKVKISLKEHLLNVLDKSELGEGVEVTEFDESSLPGPR